MLTSRWVALLALSVAMLLPSAARADDPPPVPLRLVDRPLTLPSGVLRGDLGFSYLRFGSADGAGASVSGGYGITDDLEVDATVLPLALAPALQYGNPTVSGTYRFVHERAVEVGGSLGVTLITRDTQLFGNATLAPSVPVLLRLGDLARIDTGVVLPITVGGPSTLAGLWIPATATFQILDPLYLGATTGLGMVDLSHASGTAYVPLGAFAGYSFPVAARALVDVRAGFSFPELFVPGASSNTVQTDAWELGLSGSLYWALVPTSTVNPPPVRPGAGVAPPPAPGGPAVASGLPEDPAITCYRATRATVTDGQGAVHHDPLNVQLGLAEGIARATCSDGAYDCSGEFYVSPGHATKVPPFPNTPRTDEDVARWLNHRA